MLLTFTCKHDGLGHVSVTVNYSNWTVEVLFNKCLEVPLYLWEIISHKFQQYVMLFSTYITLLNIANDVALFCVQVSTAIRGGYTTTIFTSGQADIGPHRCIVMVLMLPNMKIGKLSFLS